MLDLRDDHFIDPPMEDFPGMFGLPGIRALTFLGVSKGWNRLELAYVQPWVFEGFRYLYSMPPESLGRHVRIRIYVDSKLSY